MYEYTLFVPFVFLNKYMSIMITKIRYHYLSI